MPSVHSPRATAFGLFHHPEWYERVSRPLTRRLYERVVADLVAAPLPSGARILDVGTGPGLLALRIAAACPQCTVDAVDLSPEMIQRAQHTAAATGRADAVTFAVADVARLPFPDGTFDVVLAILSLHHWPDPRAGLRELNRVLRPEAQVWIYDLRWSLGRARRAAATVTPPPVISGESPLAGTSRFNPMGRLVLRA